MDHIALDGTWPHDRHLDDEVVKGSGLDARKHRHLGSALDLEGAERVGFADHRVGARVLRRDRRQIEIDALMLSQEVESLLHAGQHPKGEDVDLHELEGVDVVLVPFDHLPVDHGGRFDRHEVVETVVGEDEAAGMLAEMARRAHELAGEIERQAQSSVRKIEVQRLDMLVLDAVLRPAPDLGRQHLDEVFGEPNALPTSRIAPLVR